MIHQKIIRHFLIIMILFTLPVIGAIRGKVRIFLTDSKGKPIEGVKVTLESQRTSVIKYVIYSNKRGMATHGSLENHIFEFTFEKEGYQPRKKMIKIPAGLLKKDNITLYTVEETVMQMEAKDPYAQAINKYNQAAIFLKKEDYEKALELLKESISLDDTIHQAHSEISRLYYLQKRYEDAIKHAKEAIFLEENYSPPYRLLAAIYEEMGNMEESQKYTILAQEVGGMSGIDKYNEAVKCINSGEVDSAIRLLEEAVQIDPKLADGYYQLGLSYMNKAENEKAISNLEKYLELEPEGQYAKTAASLLEFLKKQ
ncbi:MAG: tetratricopeptide repeat protein [Candidatus Aminicenantes bacterium]|nr:MAG: tetratricopeptide repeat protein [Candidatus Aminicenantes bacterium]